MRIKLLLVILGFFYLGALLYTQRTRAVLDGSDSWGYYVHLPAALLYHDTGDYSKTIAAWQVQYPNKPDPRKDAYGIRPTPSGNLAVKYPIGAALLEAPFFAGAHVYCLLGGGKADGFSAPYSWAVALSSLFFALLGLFLTYKNLRFYFSETVSLITTTCIGLATNLFFFVVYTPGMSHPLMFCLIASLLLITRNWYAKPSLKSGVYLGLNLGLIAITRTQDLVIALVPLLWGIQHWKDINAQFKLIWVERKSVFAGLIAFLVAILPQAIYWKTLSGQWWRYGYQGEKFDWAHPHLKQGLLSFQNGWLIYTPIMILALWGLYRLRRYAPAYLVPILIFLPLHWFISYSWWCWMYINGFGSRPMVDAYALLALPLAAWIAHRKDWVYLLVLAGFAVLNIFQTWQTKQGILWPERGNWAHYSAAFGETKGSAPALAAFESGEVLPGGPLKMVRVLNPKALSIPVADNEITIAGRKATRCAQEFSQTLEISADSCRLLPGDWLRVSVEGYVPASEKTPGIDQLAKLVVDFSNDQNKVLKYRAINIGTQIGNPDYILWKTRGTETWGEASFWVMVPMGYDAKSRVKTYIWNPQLQEIFVEVLRIELWR